MAEGAQEANTFFSIEKIYVKDVSYEAPAVPSVFLQQDSADTEIGMQLNTEHAVVAAEQNVYEVILTITVSAKRKDKTIFLVEVQQAGIFRIAGVNQDILQRVLAINCATVLLPFAREAINDFVGKGGFPQLLIAPINFDVLYQQQKTAKANAQN